MAVVHVPRNVTSALQMKNIRTVAVGARIMQTEQHNVVGMDDMKQGKYSLVCTLDVLKGKDSAVLLGQPFLSIPW